MQGPLPRAQPNFNPILVALWHVINFNSQGELFF